MRISVSASCLLLLLLLSTTTFSQSKSGNNTITSGNIQITAASGWRAATDLNDKADLQAVDGKGDIYLIVLTDNKADYRDMTLDKHSQETLGTLTKLLTSMTKTGPTNLKINGHPAVQYEVRGTIQGMNVVYLHTTVETTNHFHQIVSWMLISTYDLKKDVVQGVVQSFKETGQ